MAVIVNTILMISTRKMIVVPRGVVPPSAEGVDVSAAFNDYLKSW